MCTSSDKTIKLDRTSPEINLTELNDDKKITTKGCNQGDLCVVAYDNGAKREGKYRGASMKADNKKAKEANSCSDIDDWGAIAKYESDGKCNWDGNAYDWKGGKNTCKESGSGRIKRCYKVKDKAGNESERVCTCQDTNGNVAIKDPKDCFK